MVFLSLNKSFLFESNHSGFTMSLLVAATRMQISAHHRFAVDRQQDRTVNPSR
jgi:hypothetical protein